MKQLKVINYEGLYNENVARIKTKGFNQWDEQWELGYFNLTTGEPTSNSNICRSKNFISVFPSTEYFYKSNNANHTILYYDIDYNYISNAQFGTSNSTINTPSNCRFIKIAWVGTTYSNNICINVSDSDRNGEYEPYWESETPLFDVTKLKDINGEIIFPYGMISHGDVADELTKTTATRWFDVYNLGDLTWNIDNTAGRFYTTGLPTNLWANDLAVMAKYPRSSTQSITDKTWGGSGAGYFEIWDSTYQTAAAFKASLANQLLFVVRTSAVVYQLQQPVPIEYRTDESGVEEYTGYNQSKPLTTLIDYDAIYDNQFYNTGRSEFADRLGDEYGNISYQELAESFNEMGDALDYAITEIEQLSEQLVELEEIVDRIDVDKFLAKTGGTMSGNIVFVDNKGIDFDSEASIIYNNGDGSVTVTSLTGTIILEAADYVGTSSLQPLSAATDIGTSTNPYRNIYGTTIYEDGVALSNKYDSWKATTNNVFRFRYLLNLLSGTNFNDIKGSFDTIRGNTVSWNQMVTRQESRTQNGITTTYSVANNLYQSQGTLSPSSYFEYGRISVIKDHKYLLHVDVLSNSETLPNYFGLLNTSGQVSTTSVGRHLNIVTAVATTGTNVGFVGNIDTSVNFKCVVNIIDLTQMFGSGNEPTSTNDPKVQWALDYAAKHPEANEGKILNLLSPEDEGAGIDTVGFNIWDEQWEVGVYNNNTGEKGSQASGYLRSKNFIRVSQNTQYYSTPNLWVFYYGTNYNYLGYRSGSATLPFTTPSNCAFITFNTNQNYGNTYNHDICINLSNTAKNGTYEPYKHTFSRLDLSSIKDSSGNTLFPYGLCGINTVHDEVSKFRAVKMIGQVDLGTLNYYHRESSGRHIFEATIDDLRLSYNANININAICPLYNPTTTNASWVNMDMAYGVSAGSNRIAFVNNNYTDAAAFKTAMSGVMLNYELAEPVIVETDWLQKQDYPAFADGSEEILSDTTMIDADITYSNDVSIVFARVAQTISDGNESMTLSDIQRAVQVLRYI